MEIFDKMVWHTDNGVTLEIAKKHLSAIMFFLKSNNMLSEDGRDIFHEDGIDIEFSLNSDVLTHDGEKFIKKYYKSYLRDVARKGEKEAIEKLRINFQLYQIKIPKNKGFLYDSIDAHLHNEKDYDNINYYFKYLLNWLNQKGLLNNEAKNFLSVDTLPKNFELRSWMFSDIVNERIPPVYDKWLNQVKLGEKVINMGILENAFNETK